MKHSNALPNTAAESTPEPEGSLAAKPLAAAEFAALMQPFGVGSKRFAVAVSGGPDSMALALCVKRWTGEKEVSFPRKRESSLSAEALAKADASDSERMSHQALQLKQPMEILSEPLHHAARVRAPLDSRFRGNDEPLLALIVDHQLRPESAAEAKAVQTRLKALGVASEILRWEHPPVASRVHVKARKARYNLLLEACLRHGIRDLLLAHQREDQAETILMRLAKGSGLDGLAGMAPMTKMMAEMQGVRLLRPLLTVPKERLVATCEAARLVYVTDPGNRAAKYARGRLRRVLPHLAEEGLTVERLVDLGDRARETREAMEHYTSALLRVAAQMDKAGMISLDLEHLRSAPRAVALRALGACLQRIHPGDYVPERIMLVPLLEGLCGDDPMPTRTLHGGIIAKGAKKATLIREYASIMDVMPIAPGQTVLWDGRWQVSLSPECKLSNLANLAKLEVRALGTPLHEELDRLAPGLRHEVQKGRARAALPALWQGENLALVPDFKEKPDIAIRQSFTICLVSSRKGNSF